jgi:hypothetical protein
MTNKPKQSRSTGIGVMIQFWLYNAWKLRLVFNQSARQIYNSCVELLAGEPPMADVEDCDFAKKRSVKLLGRIHSAIYFLLISIAVSTSFESADAADWNRLPDGRVVIDIKGIKFAFRASDGDLDSIHFNLASPQHATLREVLASPDRNREIFDRNADTNITMYVREKGGLFVDRFDRNALNSVGFAFDVGENQRNCTSWGKAFNRAKAEDPKDQKLEYGWRESVTAGIEKVYTRAPGSAEGSEEIQSLYCNESQHCGSSICLLPNLSFIFRFSSVAHPKSRWADLLKNVDDVLNYVLPERSTGKTGR